ncbi:ENV2 protein, partial [Pandion haliaetus]|nr:ENV2 protein [Pandion haliaetus]
RIMQSSYQILHTTNPTFTEHCWLCYGIRPLYYEAVGVTEKFRRANSTNPKQCAWRGETQGITLTQVAGKSRCIG